MPLASLYLISLQPATPLSSFVTLLHTSLPGTPQSQPLLIARPIRWIIEPWIHLPTSAQAAALEALTLVQWDIFLILPTLTDPLPAQLLQHVRTLYSLRVGIPSKIAADFKTRNMDLLHPAPNSIPELTGSLEKVQVSPTSKDLKLTAEISQWLASPTAPKTAPCMLNFLSFHPGKQESYKAYGQAFASDVGIRRGGIAKIVGSVPHKDSKKEECLWDEIAVAHYPTVWHFADMVASEDYQEVNARYRVGAIRGTAILCCNELDQDILKGVEAVTGDKSKI